MLKKYDVTLKMPIMTAGLKLEESYHNSLIDYARNFNDVFKNSTNVKADMTEFRVWDDAPQFLPLLDDIINIIQTNCPWFPLRNFSEENGGKATDKRLGLYNAWVARYNENDVTLPHNHIPSTISFVYYLKVDEGCAPLVFDDSNFAFHPKTFSLIYWPSVLNHSVPKCNTKERIVLAGNVLFENQ